MGFNSQQGQEFLVWDLSNLLPDGYMRLLPHMQIKAWWWPQFHLEPRWKRFGTIPWLLIHILGMVQI